MTLTLYVILVLLIIAIAFEGMVHLDRVYQVPFGAAAVFGGFIAPPLFGLLNVDYLPEWALERYLFMCILCLAMIWLGDSLARRNSPVEAEPATYDAHSWLLAATLLVLVGGAAYAKSRSLFESGMAMNEGLPVALDFAVALLRYGFVMALIYYLSTRNPYALAVVGFAGLYYVDRIVFFGRRGIAISFAFIVAGAVWFVLGKRLPRAVILAAIACATVFVFTVAAYRSVAVSTTGQRDWSRLWEVNVFEQLRENTREGSSETTCGIYLLAASAEARAYDFGLYHWNRLVFNFVPAQLFGRDLKESLILPVPDPRELAQSEFGYVSKGGTTATGMVDCYASFWYLGCLKFLVIAYIMQRFYQRAINGGIMAQVIYLHLMGVTLETITHHTHWFVRPWVHIACFWIPAMLYCRWRGQRAASLSLAC